MKSTNCWTNRFQALKVRLEAELREAQERVTRLEAEIDAVEAESLSTSPSMVRWLRANEKVS
jgi:uncharacterized protein YlxW (UPF0749 family)